jgi:hypothetical protein
MLDDYVLKTIWFVRLTLSFGGVKALGLRRTESPKVVAPDHGSTSTCVAISA